MKEMLAWPDDVVCNPGMVELDQTAWLAQYSLMRYNIWVNIVHC